MNQLGKVSSWEGVTGGHWGWQCQGPTQPRQGVSLPLLPGPESGQPKGNGQSSSSVARQSSLLRPLVPQSQCRGGHLVSLNALHSQS